MEEAVNYDCFINIRCMDNDYESKDANKKLLKVEIDKLNDRDKEIIEYRYGLNGKDELTQKEVADLLGISQSYISRIEKKVIKKLGILIR